MMRFKSIPPLKLMSLMESRMVTVPKISLEVEEILVLNLPIWEIVVPAEFTITRFPLSPLASASEIVDPVLEPESSLSVLLLENILPNWMGAEVPEDPKVVRMVLGPFSVNPISWIPPPTRILFWLDAMFINAPWDWINPYISSGDAISTFRPPRKFKVSLESPRMMPPVLTRFVFLVTVVVVPRNLILNSRLLLGDVVNDVAARLSLKTMDEPKLTVPTLITGLEEIPTVLLKLIPPSLFWIFISEASTLPTKVVMPVFVKLKVPISIPMEPFTVIFPPRIFVTWVLLVPFWTELNRATLKDRLLGRPPGVPLMLWITRLVAFPLPMFRVAPLPK